MGDIGADIIKRGSEMTNRTNRFRIVSSIVIATQLIMATPAFAADDTTETGLLAALGLQAASGETKLGEKGGEIEGWMLASRYLQPAGEAILTAARNDAGTRPVVLLAAEQPFRLAQAGILRRRIETLKKRVIAFKCAKTSDVAQWKAQLEGTEATPKPNLWDVPSPGPKDFAGSIKTTTDIAGFAIEFQDRALISAIGRANEAAPKVDLRLPADMTAIPAESPIMAAWDTLTGAMIEPDSCPTQDRAKALREQYGALDTFANTPGEKGENSPLENAAAIDRLAEPGATPLLLRVAVEKAGGTTVVRSNIFLTLGFPGAVRLSGGVVVSYRLIDPVYGKLMRGGVIQCALPQTDFWKVAKIVNEQPAPTTASCGNVSG